jgi:hypothetical protein
MHHPVHHHRQHDTTIVNIPAVLLISLGNSEYYRCDKAGCSEAGTDDKVVQVRKHLLRLKHQPWHPAATAACS